jgi:hypothetical protein
MWNMGPNHTIFDKRSCEVNGEFFGKKELGELIIHARENQMLKRWLLIVKKKLGLYPIDKQ